MSMPTRSVGAMCKINTMQINEEMAIKLLSLMLFIASSVQMETHYTEIGMYADKHVIPMRKKVKFFV